MNAPPHRPWWKKKRWLAALALWLAFPVLFLAAAGPVAYMEERDWIPDWTYKKLYLHPILWMDEYEPFFLPWFRDWVVWCRELGAQHCFEEHDARSH